MSQFKFDLFSTINPACIFINACYVFSWDFVSVLPILRTEKFLELNNKICTWYACINDFIALVRHVLQVHLLFKIVFLEGVAFKHRQKIMASLKIFYEGHN